MNNEEVCWVTFARIVKRMNDMQLLFAIEDARKALECAHEFEKQGLPNSVNKYRDQIAGYQRELDRRYKSKRR